ncbi:MAG: hypothetical protein ACM37W_17875 [Actinomycetota bacterium]
MENPSSDRPLIPCFCPAGSQPDLAHCRQWIGVGGICRRFEEAIAGESQSCWQGSTTPPAGNRDDSAGSRAG